MALSGLALASKALREDSELSERDKLSSEGQRALQRELLTVDIRTLLGIYIYIYRLG